MAKTIKEEAWPDEHFTVNEAQVAVSPEAVEATIAAMPHVPAPKKISFEQFVARSSKVKAHHTSGMRAFVKNPGKSRTEEEWNTLFENY